MELISVPDRIVFDLTGKLDERLVYARPAVPGLLSVCLHTRMGVRPVVVGSPDERFLKRSVLWRNDFPARCNAALKRRHIRSAHFGVDGYGAIGQYASPSLDCTMHARQMNKCSIGIEMYQDASGRVALETLRGTVALVGALCDKFGVPRECFCGTGFAGHLFGTDDKNQYTGFTGGAGGLTFRGVFGHRNSTRNRGPGDPGNDIFDMLLASGFRKWGGETL